MSYIQNLLKLTISNPEVLSADQGNKFIFDVENNQEKCTPFTLAVVKEHFDIANLLLEDGRSDRFYKNSDGKNVFDMAKELNLKNV